MHKMMFRFNHKFTTMSQKERAAVSMTVVALSVLLTLLLLHAIRPMQGPLGNAQTVGGATQVETAKTQPVTKEPKKIQPSKLSVYASNIAPCKPFSMTYIDAYGNKRTREIEGIVPEYGTCAFTEELPYGGLMTCWIKTDEQYNDVTDYYKRLDKSAAPSDSVFEPLVANGTCAITGYEAQF